MNILKNCLTTKVLLSIHNRLSKRNENIHFFNVSNIDQLLLLELLIARRYKYSPLNSELALVNWIIKVSKGAKIRNWYNQVPYLTQDTNGKVTNSQLDTTNESQEVSPFPAGDHKAHIKRRAQMHSKHKTEKNIKYPQKEYRLGMVSTWGLKQG